ncbi:hypothetical protein EB796_004703 [Bugula neritina]|uniref:Uncharacterized protein n=1 Tax=Bugula neritina TaxID=10212 RepID=A0A7J7KGH0_BUGNE|nr:hypothetical protein EB796_004703 [Bugula neritina]
MNLWPYFFRLNLNNTSNNYQRRRPPEPFNYTLVPKLSPKYPMQPKAVPKQLVGRQWPPLQTWGSTGSITPAASEVCSQQNGHSSRDHHHRFGRSVSVDNEAQRYAQQLRPWGEDSLGNQIKMNSRAKNQHMFLNNMELDKQLVSKGTHTQLPLTMNKSLRSSMPKQSRMVQENFRWQDENNPIELYPISGNHIQSLNNNQPEHVTNNTRYYTGNNLDRLVFYGPNTSPPSHHGHDHGNREARRRTSNRGNLVPFTQKTGNESHQNFIQLMKPALQQSNHTHLKPPIAPNKKSKEKKFHSANDENVIYTEIVPQLANRRGSMKPEKARLVRSRSNSPVIYTEVVPIDSTDYKPERNNTAANKSNRASMTFGDESDHMKPLHDQPIAQQRPERKPKLSHLNSQKPGGPNNFSMSFGTPQLLRKYPESPINTNHMNGGVQRKHNETVQASNIENKVKPFPSNNNLEKMLSSDTNSSKKSGTIKSALKQPTGSFSGTEKKDQRSPKRVTIKESDSGRTTPTANFPTWSKLYPVNGLTMSTVNLTNHRKSKPLHRLRVIDRKLL